MASEPRSPALNSLLERIQEEALPGLWSRGVALSRESRVRKRVATRSDELLFQVTAAGQVAASNVQVWAEDDDYFCDCKTNSDPCVHVCAVAAAIRSGTLEAQPSETSERATLIYTLEKKDGSIALKRNLRGEGGGDSKPYAESLFAMAAKGSNDASVFYDQDDLAIDRFLSNGEVILGRLNADGLQNLMRRLKIASSQERVEFEGRAIQVSTEALLDQYVVRDENGGFRLLLDRVPAETRVAAAGFAFSGSRFQIDSRAHRSAIDREKAEREGVFYRALELGKLAETVVPELRKRARVRIESKRLIETERADGWLNFSVKAIDANRFEVSADVIAGTAAETQALAQKLRNEFQMAPHSPRVLSGDEAVGFAAFLNSRSASGDISIMGDGLEAYRDVGELKAQLRVLEDALSVDFQSAHEGAAVSAEAVIGAYRMGSGFVSLGSGKGFARLPKAWLDRFSEIVERWLSARGTKDHAALKRVSGPGKTAYLDALRLLADENVVVQDSAEFEIFKRAIESNANLPAANLPNALRAELRPYQREGVAWMQFLMKHGFGVLLADDMGLGKTVQALSLEHRRTLIVCPTSVVHSWKEQCERFRPDLSIHLYWGPSRQLSDSAQITITTYGTLRQDAEALANTEFDLVVLDEAHAIKNVDRKTSQAAFGLNSRARLALTGTPIENHAGELRSLFQFLMPGSFDDSLSLEEFRTQVKPLTLRRLKRDVAQDLPERTEVVLEIDLSAEERQTYTSIEAAAELTSSVSILESLLRLRQIACHSGLVPGFESTIRSTKVEFLCDRLAESIEGGHACLVFSQWTSLLDRIERSLKERGIRWARLDGSMPQPLRAKIVDEFQAESGAPVLLMSLKAGGVGITLTRADHVFICDPWWNPAAEAQAADRAHRIGQKRPVLISKLVARDTVEDRMIALQKAKLDLAASFLEARDLSQAFTLDELKSLVR